MYPKPVSKITITVSPKYISNVVDFLNILARDYQVIDDSIITIPKNPGHINQEVKLLQKLIRQYQDEFHLGDDFQPDITC